MTELNQPLRRHFAHTHENAFAVFQLGDVMRARQMTAARRPFLSDFRSNFQWVAAAAAVFIGGAISI